MLTGLHNSVLMTSLVMTWIALIAAFSLLGSGSPPPAKQVGTAVASH